MHKNKKGFTQHYNNVKSVHSRTNDPAYEMNSQTSRKSVHSAGFTLIEILLVIGVIAVLATVVIVALDPSTRFKNARDTRRLSDIESILTAVKQYIVDNQGTLPPGFDDGYERQLGTSASGCELTYGICSANLPYCLDFSVPLAKYLKSTPYDPNTGSPERTHYSIQVDGNGIVTVRACDSTDDTISSVSR